VLISVNLGRDSPFECAGKINWAQRQPVHVHIHPSTRAASSDSGRFTAFVNQRLAGRIAERGIGEKTKERGWKGGRKGERHRLWHFDACAACLKVHFHHLSRAFRLI